MSFVLNTNTVMEDKSSLLHESLTCYMPNQHLHLQTIFYPKTTILPELVSGINGEVQKQTDLISLLITNKVVLEKLKMDHVNFNDKSPWNNLMSAINYLWLCIIKLVFSPVLPVQAFPPNLHTMCVQALWTTGNPSMASHNEQNGRYVMVVGCGVFYLCAPRMPVKVIFEQD